MWKLTIWIMMAIITVNFLYFDWKLLHFQKNIEQQAKDIFGIEPINPFK